MAAMLSTTAVGALLGVLTAVAAVRGLRRVGGRNPLPASSRRSDRH